jgi:hypothetical protein
MRKIIASNFELDLSDKQLTTNEQNSWFTDAPVLKYTFPFEFFLTDEIDAALGFISSHNTSPQTLFDVWHSYHDEMEQAVLEINEVNDRTIQAELSIGYENLPSWDSKLSELPLENFQLPEGVSIYEHAESILNDNFPEVNYNFPKIHIDKIDVEDDVWFAFGGLINNRIDGAFLENTVDLEEEITYNRNIMQPLPSLIHVLKAGAEAAGLELDGEILTDSLLTKALIYADVEYYTTITQESQSIFQMSEDFVETGVFQRPLAGPENYNKYFVNFPIENPGKYRLVGKVTIFHFRNYSSEVVIKYRNTVLKSYVINANNIFGLNRFNLNVDVVIETLVDLDPNFITVESTQRKTTNQIIFELDLNPIRLHDASGEAIPSIINLNQINLSKAVPEMSYGELVKTICAWFNYDYDVVDGKLVMNLIQNEMDSIPVISMERFEVKKPLRKFQTGISFLLKFNDIDSKDYKYEPVFQNINGVFSSENLKDDKTIPIEINALPLPLVTRNNVQTAHAFEASNTKLFLVFYDGLTDGQNVTLDNAPALLPAVHESNYKKWFEFRIHATNYKWRFLAFYEDILDLKIKTKIYAYGRNHFVKTLQKTELKPDLLEVEIECES